MYFSKVFFSKSVFSVIVFSESVFFKSVFSERVFSESVVSEYIFQKCIFKKCIFWKCIFQKCIYPKCIFAKCTRLACLLSFASLFFYEVSTTAAAQSAPIWSRLDIAQIYSIGAILNENWYFYRSQKIAQHMRKSETVDIIAEIDLCFTKV